MFFKSALLATAFVLTSAGCDVKPTLSIDGTEDAANAKPDYANQPLQGQIRKTSWLARSGKAEVNPSDSNRIQLSLSDEEFENPCQQMWNAKRVVMVSVPRVVGETVLGQMPDVYTATFFTAFDGGTENAIATDGKVRVNEISNEKVSGMMVIRADDGYEVNGKFEVAICHR